MLEKAGLARTVWVGAPSEKFLPSGYDLAADFAALSSPHPGLAKSKLEVKGSKMTGKIACPAEFVSCNDIEAIASGKAGKKAVKVAKGKLASVAGGKSKTLKLKLTSKGKKYFADKSKLKVTVEITSAEVAEATSEKATAKRK